MQKARRADFIEKLLRRMSASNSVTDEVVVAPAVIMDDTGATQPFASVSDLIRGMIHYADARRRADFRTAAGYLSASMQTLEVEQLALQFTGLLHSRLISALEFSSRHARETTLPMMEIILQLYMDYTSLSRNHLLVLLREKQSRITRSWNELCEAEGEDNLTPARLKAFYQGLEFPLTCNFPWLLESSLVVAQVALPLLVASWQKTAAAFDYGGNSGLLTSAMAAAGIQRVLLVEISRPLLDFARWRDLRMGLKNVEYLELIEGSAVELCDNLRGAFDFGACIEVLEHVADIDDAVRTMADLLRPGGLLFLGASFETFPHPTHLRRNSVYAGQEDRVMERLGFERVPVTFPIPPRGNERLYRRLA